MLNGVVIAKVTIKFEPNFVFIEVNITQLLHRRRKFITFFTPHFLLQFERITFVGQGEKHSNLPFTRNPKFHPTKIFTQSMSGWVKFFTHPRKLLPFFYHILSLPLNQNTNQLRVSPFSLQDGPYSKEVQTTGFWSLHGEVSNIKRAYGKIALLYITSPNCPNQFFLFL